jgi:hypothetical protein
MARYIFGNITGEIMIRISTLSAGLLATLLLSSSAALAADLMVTTVDDGAGPESITAAPDGGLILGSANKPAIYRSAKGATEAKKFIDASADGAVTFLGVLSEPATNTLWACELKPTADGKGRASTLVSYNLKSGAPKSRWALPGATNVCNDMSVGPDKALYVSDTGNGRIYRLKPGAAEGELVLEDKTDLGGIDGLAFMNGVLYANNVQAGTIWRVPLDSAGKAGTPVQIKLDVPLKGPDGMRVAGNALFVAENRNNRASMITISGDTGHVTMVLGGLATPTAIEPAGNVLWVGDRIRDNATAIPMPK